MNSGRLKFILTREGGFYLSDFCLRVGHEVNGGKWAIMRPAQFNVLSEDEAALERQPAMLMSKDDAQRLMDELWTAGVRPSEGSGSAGQLAAVQAHLRDMQRLVFDEPRQA